MDVQPDLQQLPRARASVEGHFGEWVQGLWGARGPLVLITLRCPALRATCFRFETSEFLLEQPDMVLDQSKTEQFRKTLRLAQGRFVLRLDMPPGGGAGASTSALVAIARAGGLRDEVSLPQACLAAEGATDPLMLPEPDAVLWASRQAAIAKRLAPPPKAEIVGGFLGKAERTDPKDLRFADVSDLVERWEKGPALDETAEIASISAKRCTELRGPLQDSTEALAKDLGALGWCRAHTGSARGLIFAPGTVPDDCETALEAAGFTRVLRFETGQDRAV